MTTSQIGTTTKPPSSQLDNSGNKIKHKIPILILFFFIRKSLICVGRNFYNYKYKHTKKSENLTFLADIRYLA